MVVRILHEGQFDVGDEALRRLDAVDDQMFDAVVAGDETRYRRLFDQTVQIIRQQGTALADDDLRPSDLVLPAPDSTLDEVRDLFVREGLIQLP